MFTVNGWFFDWLRLLYADHGYGMEDQRYAKIIEDQKDLWIRFFLEECLNENQRLADELRYEFSKKPVDSCGKLYSQFAQFVKQRPAPFRDQEFAQQQQFASSSCDYCEGHGVLKIPMVNCNTGEENDRMFRCICPQGKIQFGGLEEATGEMQRWRLAENRREEIKAHAYLRRLGLDPQECTFAEMWGQSQNSRGPLFVSVADLDAPVPTKSVVHASNTEIEEWTF